MPAPDESYYAALDRLIRPVAASRLPDTLVPMQALLAALDHPERQYPVVVVAGSTGKGTAALRLATGLAAGGLRVGLYTSPHLHSFRERFVIFDPTPGPSPLAQGGEKASRAGQLLPLATQRSGVERGPRSEGVVQISFRSFVTHAEEVLSAANAIGFTPGTFESATALAFRWFAAERVEIAVCEIGLGGRFDAVNAAPHALALIGPIEREHAAMLGGSLERIAWHKAGVIPAGGVAVVQPPTAPSVRAVFEREAARQGAALVWASDIAAAGWSMLQQMGLAPGSSHVPDAVALPGRLERVTVRGRRVLIDGGHTPLAARRLAAAIAPDLPGGVRIIIGMLADKDAPSVLAALGAPDVRLVCTTAPAARALPAEALAAAWTPQFARPEIEPSFEQAIADGVTGPEALLVIAGSLRMAAAARESLGLLGADAREEARRTRALFEGEAYRQRWRR